MLADKLPRFFWSIRFRLVATSVVLSGFTLALLSTYLYRGIEATQETAFDTSLNNFAVDVANATNFDFLGGVEVDRSAMDENKVFPFPLGKTLVQILSANGRVVLSTRNLGGARLPISTNTLGLLGKEGVIFESITLKQMNYRMVNYLINKPSVPTLILQVAVPLENLLQERQQIRSLIWTLIPLALVFLTLSGLFLANRSLGPIQNIISRAQSISPQHLSDRIAVPPEIETKELALTLNDLLSRLQNAFDSQERFIADASHQLKTPLAIIKGEIEVYLKSASDAQVNELLKSTAQEIDHLAKIVNDLLLLARFDSGTLTPTFAKVRVDEILLESIASLNKMAIQKSIALDFQVLDNNPESPSSFEVSGDYDLLKALFFNLIENSLKYCGNPGAVKVRLRHVEREIAVEISDNGPGIAKDELPLIFERFYRSPSRQHQVSGVGLGLSIASRIAKFHGATLDVSSEFGLGTSFLFKIKEF